VQAPDELYRSRKEKAVRSWSEVRRILEKGNPADLEALARREYPAA
jgi:hypothetical protein